MVLRRGPLARAEVALYGPARAAVMLHPRPGRWPEEEEADRLALGIGLAALAAGGAPAERWGSLRNALTGVARGLAATPVGPLPGDLAPLGRGPLLVVRWEGRGRIAVEAEILASPSGAVPRLRSHRGRGGDAAVGVASLALLLSLGADASGDGRLALALGVEGLLAWLAESHRSAPARHAVAFALAHAEERMREARRQPPPVPG